MRVALNNANVDYKNFDYTFKNFKLQFNWVQGKVPQNQIKFDLFSNDNNKVCAFDFQVEAFQEHLGEELEDSNKNKEFHQ